MTRWFDTALAAGYAEISAYIGSPVAAERTTLDFRQLDCLTFVSTDPKILFEGDFGLADAMASDGTKLFQIGVELESPSNVWGVPAPPADWARLLGVEPSTTHLSTGGNLPREPISTTPA